MAHGQQDLPQQWLCHILEDAPGQEDLQGQGGGLLSLGGEQDFAPLSCKALLVCALGHQLLQAD
eukprot:2799228-Lingulodinium_polyedra.AAC.1